MNIFLEGAPSR